MNEGAQILKAMHEAEARDDKEAMRALLRKQGGRLLETVPHASIKKEARAFLDRHRETGDAGPVVRLLTGLMQIVGAYADQLGENAGYQTALGYLHGEAGRDAQRGALRGLDIPRAVLEELLQERR